MLGQSREGASMQSGVGGDKGGDVGLEGGEGERVVTKVVYSLKGSSRAWPALLKWLRVVRKFPT